MESFVTELGQSLRKRINLNCQDCIYDKFAPGTWRQQVTLCAVNLCPFYDIRPKTTSAIPISVLSYYGVSLAEYERINRRTEVCTPETEQ